LSSITWLKDGKPVPLDEFVKVKNEGNKQILCISNCTTEDAGQYTCVVESDAGKLVTSATVDVSEDKTQLQSIQQLPAQKQQHPEQNKTDKKDDGQASSSQQETFDLKVPEAVSIEEETKKKVVAERKKKIKKQKELKEPLQPTQQPLLDILPQQLLVKLGADIVDMKESVPMKKILEANVSTDEFVFKLPEAVGDEVVGKPDRQKAKKKIIKKVKDRKEQFSEEIEESTLSDEAIIIDKTGEKTSLKESIIKQDIDKKGKPKVETIIDKTNLEVSDEEETLLPVLEVEPKPQTVTQGDTIVIKSKLSPVPQCDVTWMKEGKALNESVDQRVKIKSDKITGVQTLEIENSTWEDTGEIVMVAESVDGIIECSVPINVLPVAKKEKLKIDEFTCPSLIKPGESIEILCHVSGILIIIHPIVNSIHLYILFSILK